MLADPFQVVDFNIVAFNVAKTKETLARALDTSFLKPEHLKGTIIDFGPARGESTSVLLGYGGHVTGVERSKEHVEMAPNLKLNPDPSKHLICTDGIHYLKSLPGETVDIIYASKFGPDRSGEFASTFLNAGLHALKRTGVIILTSDATTVNKVISVSGDFGWLQTPDLIICKRGLKNPGRSIAP